MIGYWNDERIGVREGVVAEAVRGGSAARCACQRRTLAWMSVNRKPVVVDPALIAEVTAAVRLYVACLNTGDDYRLYAVLTDNFLRTLPAGDGFLVDDDRRIDAKTTPIAIRWGYLSPMPRLLTITALDDGRVAADIAFSRPEGNRRTTLVWIDLGGRWLVDEERESVDEELRPRDVEDFQA